MPSSAADPTPVVLHPRYPPGVDEALGRIPEVELIRPADEDGVVAALAGSPVLVTFRWRDEFLTLTLRWVQSISAGIEQFPVEAFGEKGVVLTSARGVHGPQVAEHAFALLLSLTRVVGVSMRDAERRVWKPRMGEELGGKVLGVLGLGAIGEEIARRGVAWGMEVIGTKAHPAGYRGCAARVYPPEQTIEVFRRAQVVISVLPDTPDTRGIIGEEALAALGRGWVVNVGRGSAVDTGALLEALDRGELQGAGLDVFEEEPLPPDSPLWTHPRVVITPHIAGLSPRYGPRLAEIFAVNLAAFRGGGDWINRVV